MRVASYNIRKAVGLDWRRDPDRIIDVLNEIDADVVVLQEADRRIGSRAGVLSIDRLEADLNLVVADVSVRPLSHGWHGNAILLKSHFAEHRSLRIKLPSTEPRGAVSVQLHNPKIEIIGVHLGLTPGMRRRQMQALNDTLLNCQYPAILAGDFNEWNARRMVFDAATSVVSPGPSFHASRPTATLDYFVLGDGLRAISSHVHHSARAKRASDHLPVVIDLEFTETGQ